MRLLSGIVVLLDRQESKPYWVHSAWVVIHVFMLPWFWWFQFDWRQEMTWTFPVFFFVIVFAMLYYLAVAVLVPTRDADFKDLNTYFYKVRPRFFAFLTLINTADVIDTYLKPGNIEDVGPTYLPVMTFVIIGNMIAFLTENRIFHQVWVVITFLVFVFFSLGIYADVFTSL